MNDTTAIDLGLKLPYASTETAWLLLAEAFEAHHITLGELLHLWQRHQEITAGDVQIIGGMQ